MFAKHLLYFHSSGKFRLPVKTREENQKEVVRQRERACKQESFGTGPALLPNFSAIVHELYDPAGVSQPCWPLACSSVNKAGGASWVGRATTMPRRRYAVPAQGPCWANSSRTAAVNPLRWWRLRQCGLTGQPPGADLSRLELKGLSLWCLFFMMLARMQPWFSPIFQISFTLGGTPPISQSLLTNEPENWFSPEVPWWPLLMALIHLV